MSLPRVEVKNVYSTDSYKNVDREDPTAILNGVAVSGLIGILRQLGDLAEFAAEIFHGIQEEVMATASRGNQLKIRLQNIEATVPPLEKAVLAQTNHIHFAYTGGVEWHPHLPNEQNHLIYNYLPHFIMDPYEECRDPPRLHLLDKYDIDGPGSCLKRYSDPTYFRRVSTNLTPGKNKFLKDNKSFKMKKKKSSPRSRDVFIANQSARKTNTSYSFSGQTSSSKTASTSDMERKSDFQSHQSRSLDSRGGSGYVEYLSTATSSLKNGDKAKGVYVSSSLKPDSCTIRSVLSKCETEDEHDNFQFSPSQGQAVCGSSSVSWEEKAELVESLGNPTDETPVMVEENSVVVASYGEGTGSVSFRFKDIENAKSEPGLQQYTVIDEVVEIKTGPKIEEEARNSEHESESEGDCFVDALIELESENDQRFQTSEAKRSSVGAINKSLENSACEDKIEQNSNSMDGLIDYSLRNEENESDKTSHQDQEACSDIHRSQQNDLGANEDTLNNSGEEDSVRFTFNPMYHHGLQENQEPEAESYGVPEAIKLWTNGGLLGLKPSKPPILAAPSSSSLDCKTEGKTVGSAEAEKNKSDDPMNSDGHETSSGFLGLSHKLYTNRLRRNGSFTPATIPENNEVTTTEKKTLIDPFREEAPIDWITSSPPLRHMKISLNPADTLKASRLKLKLSDEDNNTFSSFQLLPDASTSLADSCSDDDTFCRSFPDMSDTDNHSLSNSEQWEESSDSHEREEHSMYYSFNETRHVDDNHAEASSVGIESESVGLSLSYLQNPAEPLPPPFPPVQWMVSKTPSEKLKDEAQPSALQDALRFAFEKHISLAPVNKEVPQKVTSAPKPEIKVHLKSTVRKKQSVNEKETEAGDFLQQIRTQQFNLRPVVMTTTKSSSAATDPIVNTKISAILEKANSIRQVVASEDGGESDTWSDM